MTSLKTSENECPNCNHPMTLRPLQPYPVVLQLVFGISFLALLFLSDWITKLFPYALWIWTAAQIILGLLLVRGRIRASKKVYRCVRCECGHNI